MSEDRDLARAVRDLEERYAAASEIAERTTDVSLTLDEVSYLLHAVALTSDRAGEESSAALTGWERSVAEKLVAAENGLMASRVEAAPEPVERYEPAMGTRALEDEYGRYVGALTADRAAVEDLRNMGVSATDLVVHQMVGVARISIDDTGVQPLWRPDPHGLPAYVTPVRADLDGERFDPTKTDARDPPTANRDGTIVDIVAWNPNSDKVALREGAAMVLGTTQYTMGSERPVPVAVKSSVREWLQGGAEGIVVVTPVNSVRQGISEEIARVNKAAAEWKPERAQQLQHSRGLSQSL